MSSILTNNGAMVALQTLKTTNRNMADVQNQISTGKAINSAKDNAATWAISKVMEADVKGFKALSDSLALGESTVSVARNATETVTDMLTEIKGKITSSQEANVDRDKIQTDIAALRDQITSVIGAAQFNGLNLIDGNAQNPVEVTASLDRAADGSVSAKNISVAAADLTETALTAGTVNQDASVAGTITAGTSGSIATFTTAPAEGVTYQVNTGVAGLTADVAYVARDGESLADVNSEMATRLNVQAAKDGLDVSFSVSDAGDIVLTNDSDADVVIAANDIEEDDGTNADGVAGGQLDLLAGIDVSTGEGAAAGLAAIESLIQTSIDTAAGFGSVEKRIEIQNDFVGKLMDSMKSGIGSLVDADMEETSARLQALQVQQQLGIQSLSMANQAPQSLLSLFR